jgi:plastocyanin
MIRRPARAALAAVTVALSQGAAAAAITVSVTGTDGKPVTQAVVVLRSATGAAAPASAPRNVVMDQIDKEFVPLVVPVQAGGAVSFPNRDNIRHHVYSFSAPRTFELKLYSGVPAKPVVFDRPGVVTLGCNIHDWMVGYVYVTDTPWFGKTGADGTAAVDAPPGEYVATAWHPWSADPATEQKLRVEAGGGRLQFRMTLVPPPVPNRK